MYLHLCVAVACARLTIHVINVTVIVASLAIQGKFTLDVCTCRRVLLVVLVWVVLRIVICWCQFTFLVSAEGCYSCSHYIEDRCVAVHIALVGSSNCSHS